MRVIVFFLLCGLFYSSENEPVIWVDDFDNNKSGTLPKGWEGRKDLAKEYYRISMDSSQTNGKYLQVVNDKTDMFIIKEIKVDIVEYPYLNWNWRVHQFPVNGKECERKKCDVPASVNVVLKASKWRPKTIKYSWSTTLEKETFTKSPYAIWPSRCDIIVLESGEEWKGEWKTEKRNVFEDYKKLYKKNKPKSKVIEAIVIMSDGDNTGSVSAADYDNIYFSKN